MITHERSECGPASRDTIASAEDTKWMKRAIQLAQKGAGRVSPNPLVGCVVVKNGRVISEGYHRRYGFPHAEQEALGKLNRRYAAGATLYISLEPCVHFGKTSPCVPLIREAGIRRVVIGIKDPNPLVNGRGILQLRKAGMKIEVGCFAEECRNLNRVFLKNMTRGLPFVGAKVAMSLDGKIATRTGESKWITSEKARRFAKKIRARYDAILVGKNTVLRDNPHLGGKGKEPLRIILDSRLETPLSSKVYRDKNVLVITTSRAPAKQMKRFTAQEINLKVFPKKIRLSPLLRFLFREKSVRSVFVEGGAEVLGSFFDERLIDFIYFFISPSIIGGREAKSALTGKGFSKLKDRIFLSHEKVEKIGRDFLITAEIS